METKSYTVEVYKTDKRTKAGERLIKKQDHDDSTGGVGIKNLYREAYPKGDGFRVEVFETYVTKTNVMTGKTYQERYDTPYFCSPSSESYWSN